MNRNFTITIPAGNYWLGDPCYAVPSRLWSDLLEDSDYFSRPCGKVRGHTVYAASTQYGDGLYAGSNGNEYPVDAGLIGLTPVELTDGVPVGCTLVCFEEAVSFGYENGTIKAGNIEIHTGLEE